MKNCMLAITISVVLTQSAFAQEAAAQTKPAEGTVEAKAQEARVEATLKEAEAAKEREGKLQAEERAKTLLEKKPVSYSGFLVEASRTPRKKKFFSLRQPRDPKNDYRNVAVDERTGRARGFVLFRIEF